MLNDKNFWKHVTKTSGCWLWCGAHGRTGYGKLGYQGKDYEAHRFSWELHNGPIPAGLCVLHKCDTRDCIHPDHLFLGTKRENTHDALQKGHLHTPHPKAQGSKHYHSVFTEADVIFIRANRTTRHADLAARFNVGVNAIRKVIYRESWQHLP